MNYSNVIINAFRATDNLIGSLQFVEEHHAYLEKMGLADAVTSSTPEWVYDPNTVVIMAECAITGEKLAGARVQKHSGDLKLPVVHALESMDRNIVNYVEHNASVGVAEQCGLWCKSEAKGLSLGVTLIEATLIVAYQMDVQHLIGLCSDITLPTFQRLGYIIEPSLGDLGTFSYPTPAYTGYTVVLRDMDTLKYAEPKTRRKINGLARQLDQVDKRATKKGELTVHYDLDWASAPRHAATA